MSILNIQVGPPLLATVRSHVHSRYLTHQPRQEIAIQLFCFVEKEKAGPPGGSGLFRPFAGSRRVAVTRRA
jgi:hypothetical protein